ncbi:hypothetical protein INS49_008333 [Diaporthe citri]|uniref:uncharacterized protein n=1 Tax=Diaporthe citri TaxID=83186 RepID=UPI001C808027|nr:uncharacterized protein INS49_008333 [Diaporthe citri]KAG6363237.1 hypothetical protein INS49_008333 [Diaporthe citri]
MSITALPETTVRLLGSAAAITTPVDVIKELLDNALDAEATSVEILVSANLIGSIQVRDNGHGIQADDYDSLGRVGHTSKLTSFEELRTFRGSTLGFRGQALASANSLGCVTVVTRCSGDPTAVKLTLCAGVGGIESQQRISAPVGTTVTVEGLFKAIPVREQVAEKEAQKNLAKAKHLFQAYALARPMIRISLKVLGGDIKQAWSYSPRPDASVREAVVQVFGAGVMSECVLKTAATETDSRKYENVRGGPRMTIEAVLPKPDADLSKMSKGSFFSVDSRPLSTSRGIMKKLLSNLKVHFKKSLKVNDEDRRLSDLFTCVNVKCSAGTYDPNVEPSKSQVLFADESQLVELFEELCAKTYQSRQAADAFATIEKRPLTRRTQTRTPPPSSDGPQGFAEPPVPYLDESSHNSSSYEPVEERFPTGSTRLVELPVTATQDPEATMEQLPTPEQNGAAQQLYPPLRTRDSHAAEYTVSDQADPYHRKGRKRKFVVNMSADPDLSSDEEAETRESGSYDLQETIAPPGESFDTSKEALNPWVIARMTAPARQTVTVNTTAHSACPTLARTEEPNAPLINAESFEEELPILRPQMGAPRDLDTPRVMRFANTHMGHLQATDVGHRDPSASVSPQTTARVAAHDLPQSPLHTERSMGRRKLPNFRPHSNILEENADPDGLVQTTLSFDKPKEPRHDQEAQAQFHISDVPTRRNPTFRKPKRVKKRDQGFVPQDACTSSEREYYLVESQNGNRIAKESLRDYDFESSQLPRLDLVGFEDSHVDHLPTVKQPSRGYNETNNFDGDPRRYLIRRRRSEAAHRRKGRQSIKRTKTDKLPLETVPSGDGTKHLVLNVDHQTVETCNASRRTTSLADYREGVRFGSSMNLEDVDDIQSRLQAVVTSWTQKTFGEKADIEIDLREAVKGTQVAA